MAKAQAAWQVHLLSDYAAEIEELFVAGDAA